MPTSRELYVNLIFETRQKCGAGLYLHMSNMDNVGKIKILDSWTSRHFTQRRLYELVNSIPFS